MAWQDVGVNADRYYRHHLLSRIDLPCRTRASIPCRQIVTQANVAAQVRESPYFAELLRHQIYKWQFSRITCQYHHALSDDLDYNEVIPALRMEAS